MKNACDDCGNAKKKGGIPHYCTKYGIPLWGKKVYCVSKEPERGKNVDTVSGRQPGEIRSEEDGN